MMNSTRSLISTIAGFCALGFTLMALIYWAAFSTPPFSFSNIDLALRVLVIAAIVSIAVYLLFSPESVGRAAQKRSTRLTANALVASLVAVGIATALNVIVEGVPSVRADLTAGQDFSLSQQTKKVLQDLGTKGASVNAIAFTDPSNPTNRQQIVDLLKEYSAQTNRLKYELVDPVAAPARAQQYGVRRYGVVVFEQGTKREVAETPSERDFTSAILRLGQTTKRTVAFMTGHGERDINSLDQKGYSQIRTSLEQDNYNVVQWSLITSPTLSLNDVSVLVLAAPTRALPPKDVAAIRSYLNAGGHGLVLTDPEMPADALASVSGLLVGYGVTPVQGFVVDIPKRFSQQDPTNVLVDTYPENTITTELNRNHFPVGFPLAMGLTITPTVPTYTVQPLIESSAPQPQSWLETDTKTQLLQFDTGSDVSGPVIMGVSVGPQDLSASPTPTATNQVNTRLVVFSDADFAANFMLTPDVPFANTDLLGNSVSWLAGLNELVSIRPKEQSAPRTIALDAGQKNLVLLTSVLGLPLLVFLFGIINWMRRR